MLLLLIALLYTSVGFVHPTPQKHWWCTYENDRRHSSRTTAAAAAAELLSVLVQLPHIAWHRAAVSVYHGE